MNQAQGGAGAHSMIAGCVLDDPCPTTDEAWLICAAELRFSTDRVKAAAIRRAAPTAWWGLTAKNSESRESGENEELWGAAISSWLL